MPKLIIHLYLYYFYPTKALHQSKKLDDMVVVPREWKLNPSRSESELLNVTEFQKINHMGAFDM